MSFQIRNIREIPGDSIAKFANEISRRLSRFLTRDQVDQLEDREDIFIDGQDFDVAVKLQANLLGTTKFNFDKEYYPPLEPDNDLLTLWIQGVNLGNRMTDWSATNKNIQLYGDPILVDGAPFDPGIKTGGVKSIALRMNRPGSPVENDEYIQVIDEDATSLDMSGVVTGKSFFVRFKAYSLAQQDGYDRTLFEKIDGPSIQDAYMATIKPDGRLKFTVMRSGVDYSWETAAGTITTDTVYDVWFTFYARHA